MTASVIPIAAGWHPAMRGDNVEGFERFGTGGAPARAYGEIARQSVMS
jgi:hypothetical protein